MNPDYSIITELQKIISRLNNGETTSQEIELVKEFILKMNFTQFNTNNSEKDLMKYLSIGWYVCEHI